MDFQANLAAFNQATDSEHYDSTFEYSETGWMVEAVETQESIDNFLVASKNYKECSKPEHGTIGGLPVVVFSKVQVHAGAQRRELSVVDFGDRRIALRADLSNYF